jgi:hypothetical protein
MVFKVDEAGVLETSENCFGGGFLLRGVVGKVGCEVNELFIY